MTDGIVEIRGKLVSADENRVVMKAIIQDGSSITVATGYAEEVRGSTNINKTSALENAETSAIGRALACLGLAGTEYASADEVANAIAQQSESALQEAVDAESARVVAMFAEMAAVAREHWDSIGELKTHLSLGAWDLAAETYLEIPADHRAKLWVAPTKGGLFTTAERDLIKGSDFSQAIKARMEEGE